MQRCSVCVGSGQVMGGGMMIQECHVCDGAGKVNAAYQESVDRIKETGLDDIQAKNFLNDELKKVGKRGRAKRQ
jgi:hypothetical protein